MTLEDLIAVAQSSSVTYSDKCDGKRTKSKTTKCGAC